jgi:hypothetical protein
MQTLERFHLGSSHDIGEIESKLAVLLRQTKANWTEMSRLTLLVQREKLYEQRGLSSFTKWLRQTAVENDREPSLLWRFLKAGRYFLQIVGSDDLERIGEAVTAAPEALERLEKVQRQAPTPIFEALKLRVLAGEATVKECRQIEKDYRPVAAGRTNRGRPLKAWEGSNEYLGSWKSGVEEDTTLLDPSLPLFARIQIAPSIKRSLGASYLWLKQCADMRYAPRHWQSHQEVRVNVVSDVGEGRRLRLDLVSVVRWSLKRPKDLFVVEIKSCLADFEADRKWTQYLDFCHFFCFAVPAGDNALVDAIAQVAGPAVGIIAVDLSAPPQWDLTYPIQVLEQPQRQQGEKVNLVYETLYERVLGWSGMPELEADDEGAIE